MSSEPTSSTPLPMTGFYAEHVHSHIHADPEQTLRKYRRRIHSELENFGIPIEQLRDKTILDIGSGWQAIVFQELGCRQVYHLDINPKHVEFLRAYIAEHHIENIVSEQADISVSLGSAANIDLAFVAGVYHHLQDREGFLYRLLPNMAANSDILFRVYRAGTWSRWLVSVLRIASVGRLTPRHLLTAYRLLHPYGQDNQFIGDMIDDLLTPQWAAFQPREFIADAEQLNVQCHCQSEPFAFDFSGRDENFRVKWHINDPARLDCAPRSLATGQGYAIGSHEISQEITELRRRLSDLLKKLNRHTDREAATVVTALYFLVRRHAGTDAFNGQIRQASPNPDLAAWRIEHLKKSLTYFHDWLNQ